MKENNNADILLMWRNYDASIEFNDPDYIIIIHFKSIYPFINDEKVIERELGRLSGILSKESYESLLEDLAIEKLKR